MKKALTSQSLMFQQYSSYLVIEKVFSVILSSLNQFVTIISILLELNSSRKGLSMNSGKKINIQQVVASVGVSSATVSRVLNGRAQVNPDCKNSQVS